MLAEVVVEMAAAADGLTTISGSSSADSAPSTNTAGGGEPVTAVATPSSDSSDILSTASVTQHNCLANTISHQQCS